MRQDEAAYVIRSSRIREWQQQCGPTPACDPAILAEVQTSVEACNKLLDQECKRIRLLLAQQHTKSGNKKS
jgi:hypothetical protein